MIVAFANQGRLGGYAHIGAPQAASDVPMHAGSVVCTSGASHPRVTVKTTILQVGDPGRATRETPGRHIPPLYDLVEVQVRHDGGGLMLARRQNLCELRHSYWARLLVSKLAATHLQQVGAPEHSRSTPCMQQCLPRSTVRFLEILFNSSLAPARFRFKAESGLAKV